MKQRLTSVIAAQQKSPINFVNARWIIVVLCIILVFALPAAGSANQSHSGLSAQISLYETMEPTWTTTYSVTPTATPTITTTPTATETAIITASPTLTPMPNRPQILVSTNNILYVYTQNGELLESHEIPYPLEPRPYIEYAREIIPGPNNTIFVINGAYDPYLSILDRNSSTWTHTTDPGWNLLSYGEGGIGRFAKYVYLNDMDVDQSGILRFNIRDGSFERYTTYKNWSTLTIGQDDLLYALTLFSREIQVLDPISMKEIRRFMLSTTRIISSVAVNSQGDIFGVGLDNSIYHFDKNGLLVDSVYVGSGLMDIDISDKGQFVVSGRGFIFVLDENLVVQNKFWLYPYGTRIYVAFAPSQ